VQIVGQKRRKLIDGQQPLSDKRFEPKRVSSGAYRERAIGQLEQAQLCVWCHSIHKTYFMLARASGHIQR
jgi:hypothetical protein